MIAPIGGVGGPLSLTPEGRYVQGANVGLNTSFQGYILCISTTPPPPPVPLLYLYNDATGGAKINTIVPILYISLSLTVR